MWALGIEMRPLITKRGLFLVYPIYAGIGGSFGYWLQGVEQNQDKVIADRRDRLLEKRKRRDEREGKVSGETAAA